MLMLVHRPRQRPQPRGRVFAVILLILAAICLVAAIAGAFYLRSGLNTVTAAAGRIKVRFESGEGFTTVVSPGESIMTAGPGAIVVVASSKDEVDGTKYSYPPTGGVTISVVDESGAPVSFNPFQGNPPPIQTDKGQLHLLGFAEANSSGNYTVKVAGSETAVRAFSMPTTEMQEFFRGGIGVLVGGGGALCGGAGFLVFGIIGGVMFLFGRKKTELP